MMKNLQIFRFALLVMTAVALLPAGPAEARRTGSAGNEAAGLTNPGMAPDQATGPGPITYRTERTAGRNFQARQPRHAEGPLTGQSLTRPTPAEGAGNAPTSASDRATRPAREPRSSESSERHRVAPAGRSDPAAALTGRTESLTRPAREPRSSASIERRSVPPAGRSASSTVTYRDPDSWTRSRGEPRTSARPGSGSTAPGPGFSGSRASITIGLDRSRSRSPEQPFIANRHRQARRYHDHRGTTVVVNRQNFIYYNFDRLPSRRRIDTGYSLILRFHLGPSVTYRPFYPYHHIRYVFVNPYGYWPADYTYARYYWYGSHPYFWYGVNPMPYQYGGDINNYYTYHYHYYNGDSPPQAGPVEQEAVRDLEERARPPEEPTRVDELFDDAVTSFEQGAYQQAAELFMWAMEEAPEDKILPFAVVQAQFAAGDYSDAARTLRLALTVLDVSEEGIFYPRGLYPADDILFTQIADLAEQAVAAADDSDLLLLLGYHYLGLGEFDQAAAPLSQAAADPVNEPYARSLLQLLELIPHDQ